MNPFVMKALIGSRAVPPVCYCTPQPWTMQTLTIAGLSDIRHCNNIFIALTSASTNPNFATSTAGTSWTSNFVSITPIDVWHDGSKYVMVGMNAGGTIAQYSTSTDGSSWSAPASAGTVPSHT